MEFSVSTPVNAEFQRVISRFNKDLFTHLLPSFPRIQLLQFDGTAVGNMLRLRIFLSSWSMDWDTQIIERQENASEVFFIDQGIRLPLFLVYWEHKHRIIKKEHCTVIIDEITYKSANSMVEYLVMPVLWASFIARKKGYRSFFEAKN